MRKACDQSRLHGIDGVGMDDRNGRARFLHGHSRGSRHHDDDVDLETKHLLCKFSEKLGAVAGVTALDDEIASFLVAEVAESLEERVIKALVPAREKPHAPDLAPSCARARSGQPASPPVARVMK